MEIANLANMTGQKESLSANARKAKTTHFQRNTEVVAKNLWKKIEAM